MFKMFRMAREKWKGGVPKEVVPGDEVRVNLESVAYVRERSGGMVRVVFNGQELDLDVLGELNDFE